MPCGPSSALPGALWWKLGGCGSIVPMPAIEQYTVTRHASGCHYTVWAYSRQGAWERFKCEHDLQRYNVGEWFSIYPRGHHDEDFQRQVKCQRRSRRCSCR